MAGIDGPDEKLKGSPMSESSTGQMIAQIRSLGAKASQPQQAFLRLVDMQVPGSGILIRFDPDSLSATLVEDRSEHWRDEGEDFYLAGGGVAHMPRVRRVLNTGAFAMACAAACRGLNVVALASEDGLTTRFVEYVRDMPLNGLGTAKAKQIMDGES